MIIYFADRFMNILGQASTELPEGLTIVDDLKTEDIESGVAIFECKIPYDKKTRLEVEAFAAVGNYILRSNGDEKEFYTIIDSENDTKNQEVYVYAEDAGLDLLNEVFGAYTADKAYPITHYIDVFAKDSGFEVGINEVANLTRKLSWDGEATATARIASVATQFDGCEVSYSFAIEGLAITNKYINIHKKRGKDIGVQLRLNKELDRIITKKSIANLATALQCTGGTPDDAEIPITLKGYKYDDGDFYVGNDGILRSREAVKKWSRYVWNKEPNKLDGYAGHIVKQYSYDTTSQQTLCAHAVTELKKACEIEVNYEVDVNRFPDNVKIGDRVNIIDDEGELYLSTRILQLQTSIVDDVQTATLGEYLIKGSGISQKVADLAAEFAKMSVSASRALEIAQAAKSAAETAETQAQEALEEASAVVGIATEAKSAAETAETKAQQAHEKATEAETAVNTVAETVSGMEETIENAQKAAQQAYEAAETAEIKATEAQEAAVKAQEDAASVVESLGTAQATADEAKTAATEAKSTADTAISYADEAKTTAAAAKLDAEQAQSDIDALGENLTTLSNTMTADYARKTDLTEATASLQTQIQQNAAEISSTASRVQVIDETANDAAAKAQAAFYSAEQAQQQATAAAELAQATQAEADNARIAADNAQAEADTAREAAETAQSVADQAESDLAQAEADLEALKASGTATADEIAAAELAVTEARNTATEAKADAEEAVGVANNAQQAANEALAQATEAQEVADNAANQARIAQMAAELVGESAASVALEKANEAAENAENAQEIADTARENAENAQTLANEAVQAAENAQTLATEAESKVTQAEADLETAKQNLAAVTSRVDATEEEVVAAKAAVEAAQAAADVAQTNATAAQTTANTAKTNAEAAQEVANNAKTAADQAQTKADEAKTAADAAQSAVDSLAVRVTSAETKITQNANSITSLATRTTTVENKFANYSTTTEMNSAIQQKADSITSSVNATIETIEIGGRNLIANTSEEEILLGGYPGSSYAEGKTAKTTIIPTANEYILSFEAKSTVAGDIIRCHFYNPNTTTEVLTSTGNKGTSGDGLAHVTITDSWKRYWVKYKQNGAGTTTQKNIIVGRRNAGQGTGEVSIRSIKFEEGNKPTDWTPAPEDMATLEEVETAQSTADSAHTNADTAISRISVAESTIQQLSDCISMLITDASGASLMKQTTNGWTFSISELQTAVESASAGVDTLAKEMGSVDAAVSALEQAVEDLEETAEYVRIKVYEDEPCIELGESDSVFKLLITNTRIMFMDGSNIPTQITTDGLVTENITVENELRQGGWIWAVRANGNYGLQWKGGS